MIKIILDSEQKERIEREYWEWFSSKYLKKLKKRRIKKIVQKAIFGKETHDDDDIKSFLLASPERLEEIKNNIEKLDKRYRNNSKSFSGLLSRIYDAYRKELAGDIVGILGVKICPYCNQNYILSYNEDSSSFVGDIDHFYPKAQYELLKVCLYNMIPVCGVCNHIKRDDKIVINNPFRGDYDNRLKFYVNLGIEACFDFMKLGPDDINIEIDESLADDSDKNEIKLFNLDRRYKGLKDEALLVIKRTKIYDDFYKRTIKGISIDTSDLKKTIVGYDFDDNRVSLSKFNKDIMNQFG